MYAGRPATPGSPRLSESICAIGVKFKVWPDHAQRQATTYFAPPISGPTSPNQPVELPTLRHPFPCSAQSVCGPCPDQLIRVGRPDHPTLDGLMRPAEDRPVKRDPTRRVPCDDVTRTSPEATGGGISGGGVRILRSSCLFF